MSKIRDIILETLKESTKKVEFILSNPKFVAGLTQAIQNDIEIEDKTLTPESLLKDWDKDAYLDKNLNWVVRQYINGAFHYGDIYKVKEDLAKFEKYKNRKDVLDLPDLNQYDYNTLAQKLDSIDDKDISLLGKGARKKAIEQGKNDIKVVYEDKDWIVIVPETEAAARYWGYGTRWCTAADSKNNQFNYYTSKYGPLFIAIKGKTQDSKEKYQCCFEAGEYKDAQNMDDRVPKDTKVFEFLKNEAKKRNAIRNYELWFDKDEITEDMILNAIQKAKELGDYDLHITNAYIRMIFRFRSIPEDFAKKVMTIYPDFIKFIDNPSSDLQIQYIDWVWNRYVKNRYEPKFKYKSSDGDLNYIKNELTDEAKAYIKKLEDEEQEKRKQK